MTAPSPPRSRTPTRPCRRSGVERIELVLPMSTSCTTGGASPTSTCRFVLPLRGAPRIGAGSVARLAAVAPETPRARATDAAATRMPAAGPTRERAERFPESAKRLGARRPGPLLGTPFLEGLLRVLLRQLLGFVGALHGQGLAAEVAGHPAREEAPTPSLMHASVGRHA